MQCRLKSPKKSALSLFATITCQLANSLELNSILENVPFNLLWTNVDETF